MAHEVTLIPGDGTGPELIGADVYEEEGTPFPERTLDSVKRTGVGIKGPTTTPVGSSFRSVNVLLRKELDLYTGIEFERGAEENEKLVRFLADELDSPACEGSGISIKPISEFGSDRIVESAFQYKGQNKVNPTALMLSGVLMLHHLGEDDAGDRLEAAIAGVIKQGDKVTYDLKPSRDDPSAVGTSEFADAVIEEMN